MILKKYKFISSLVFSLATLSAVSCKKDTDKIGEEIKRDTIMTVEKPADTLSKVISTTLEDNHIILDVDASILPIRLVQEIKTPNDQIIIRLQNYDKSTLKAFIKPDKEMNIRFNQIRKPDNTFDGPFAQSIDYKTPNKGEYWLILSKDNMASGNVLGKFYLKVEE